MSQKRLHITYIIAILLMPVVAAPRLAWQALHLDYASELLNLYSILLGFFAIFCIFVCIYNFIRVHNLCLKENNNYKIEMLIAYCFTLAFTFVFAFSLIFRYSTFSYSDFGIGLLYACCILLLIGIVLLLLGLSGLFISHMKNAFYLKITFIGAGIFIFISAFCIAYIYIEVSKALRMV